jgi:nitrite reductase/ring-hydroxylating ferredoxin subunit
MSKLTWYKIQNPKIPLEGKSSLLKIGGKKICLSKFKGELYALENKCPHAGGNLAFGKCTENGEVVCPLHHFRYDLKTGKNTSGEGLYVDNFPIRESENIHEIGIKSSWLKRLFS